MTIKTKKFFTLLLSGLIMFGIFEFPAFKQGQYLSVVGLSLLVLAIGLTIVINNFFFIEKKSKWKIRLIFAPTYFIVLLTAYKLLPFDEDTFTSLQKLLIAIFYIELGFYGGLVVKTPALSESSDGVPNQ